MKELKSFNDIVSYENNAGFKSLTGKSIVLDFYADWCGPCKVAGPLVEKLSIEMPNVDFFKVNVEDNPEMATLFAVRAIPTFVVVTSDSRIATRIGWEGEDNFKKFVESSI